MDVRNLRGSHFELVSPALPTTGAGFVARMARCGRLVPIVALALVALSRAAGAAELRLFNDWTNAPFSTSVAEAFVDEGIVYLKGAVQGGSDPEIAVPLPEALRPAARVYVAINLCNAEPGRLIIEPTGQISVQSSTGFGAAQCFTSLDGARYARDATGFTPLALLNGWINAPFSTSSAAARLIDGVVHLKGAVSGGSASALFTLPVGMRPATDVYVPVNLCNAVKGRLWIAPSGLVSVQSTTDLTDAQCFTSLDGAAFAPAATGFTNVALLNGWTNAPYSTSDAAVSMVDGIVRFKGAVASGSDAVLFQLPPAMRPASDVYVEIDLCGAAPGRLWIQPSGEARVQEPPGSGFGSAAQCFTSLDGASFVPSPPDGFSDLPLQNGWIDGAYGTQTAGVALYDGVVHFRGAIASGSVAHVFTLPIVLRPESRAYVAVDLFGAETGRLVIDPDTGIATVQAADGLLSTAQGFVSLEGASYDKSSTGIPSSFALTLVNGWTPTGFGTAPPAASVVNDLVVLRGAVSSGASNLIATLLPAFRPATDVYVSVGLCNAAKGRLRITPSGEVSVFSTTAFADAQCFTSLDGVWFARSESGFAPLTPLGDWTPTVFGTSAPAATIHRDIVRLRGAISSGSTDTLFTLPPVLRPPATVYTPVDLCNGAKGRLVIQPSGSVRVQALDGFTDAQCFTSLDGAAYAVPEPAAGTAIGAGLLAMIGAASARGMGRHARRR